jgi:predicted ArsR family transcriptional regulator
VNVDDSLAADVSAVAALDEPTRRRLYDHVVRQSGPVGRDDAAAALDLPRTTAAFHLDKLVEQGLLDVSYERRTGRTGPGAGRTAKLYRRSPRQIGVSLPERRYDLAGRLLAGAVAQAERTGQSPAAALDQQARDLGRDLAVTAGAADDRAAARVIVQQILETNGFEPRTEQDDVVLANCPFHTLAQEHTALVCRMNLCLVQGLLDRLPQAELGAHLDPQPGCCCVRLRTADAADT